MSVNTKFYVIAGYDLTNYKTDKYDDWFWTDEGEKYICNQTKGHIQLFDDPMCGNHLYFGYVLASGEEYEFDTTKFTINDIERQIPYVYTKLNELEKTGAISVDHELYSDFKIIAFVEYT